MAANRKPETFPVGSSKKRPYELTTKDPVTGVVSAIDGAGLTPELVISTSKTEQVDIDGDIDPQPTVDWLDRDAGTIEVGGLEGLPIDNYYWRLKLTNEDDEVEYWPNEGEALVWSVVAVSAHP